MGMAPSSMMLGKQPKVRVVTVGVNREDLLECIKYVRTDIAYIH